MNLSGAGNTTATPQASSSLVSNHKLTFSSSVDANKNSSFNPTHNATTCRQRATDASVSASITVRRCLDNSNHCSSSSSSSSDAFALINNLRRNVILQSNSRVSNSTVGNSIDINQPPARQAGQNTHHATNDKSVISPTYDNNDDENSCYRKSASGISCTENLGEKFSFGSYSRDRQQVCKSKINCDEPGSKHRHSPSGSSRAICSGNSEDDEGIGAAEELLQQFYREAQRGASSKLKAQTTSVVEIIPPFIPDPQQSQLQLIAEREPLLRLNLTRASVANNCSKKQRGPLLRWWFVEHLQTEYPVMGAEDGFLTPGSIYEIGTRKLSIGANNTIRQKVNNRLQLSKSSSVGLGDKPAVDCESPHSAKSLVEVAQNDSGVVLQEGGGSSEEELSGDDGTAADAVIQDVSPAPDTPAMKNLSDVLSCLEQMCLPNGIRPRRQDFGPAYRLNAAAAFEHHAVNGNGAEVSFEIRDGNVAVQLSCAFHTHAGDMLTIPTDCDDDGDADDAGATVLVNQSTTTTSPLSLMRGVSKKRYGLVSGKFTKLPYAGGAFHGVRRYVHREILENVMKNFGLLQPDEFMQKCWKKISCARSNQNILILDAPSTAVSAVKRNDMGNVGTRDSISALRYLVPLISQRCTLENDIWGDGVGMQPRIAIVCKTAADAEWLSKTCNKLMPRFRIALAIGLETSEHEDSRRERRNLLDGAQIIIASSMAFDRYAADWRAASDMLDDVRVIVVESAAAVLSSSCELLRRWHRLAVTDSHELPTPQLILVDSHGPAVGIINKFLCEITADKLRSSNAGEVEGSKQLDSLIPINWVKVVAHPLDKLLFDNWQWEFVETAEADEVANNKADDDDVDAAFAASKSTCTRIEQFCACIHDIVCGHSRIPMESMLSTSSRLLPKQSQNDDTVLMLACYYSDDRAAQFLNALNKVGAALGPKAVSFSKISNQMSDTEQRVIAMRWQTNQDSLFHILLVQDSSSLKMLPTLPKMPVLANSAVTYPSCEGAIFIDLPETQADFMDRVLLLATLPPLTTTAAVNNDGFAGPSRRVLYQFFDHTMKRPMRGLVFMLNYAQHFAAGNAKSKLEHSFAVHAPLQELNRVGPICRQFMLTGTCLLNGTAAEQQVVANNTKAGAAVSGKGRSIASSLTGCLMRHDNLNVPFSRSESFLRLGHRFRFELLCLLSPVEIIGYLEEIDDHECTDELYEEMCEKMEKHVQNVQPISASVCRENDGLLIAEFDHCVFRCRLIRKLLPYSIIVEDYDCTLFRDMATGISSGGGVVMRNGHVQLPLRNTRLFPLPRTLDPNVTYNRTKQYKCFKVKMYLPSLLPAEPAGVDMSWFPSVTKTANAFFQQHKNCRIHAKAEAFSDEWVAIDDIIATLTLFSVKETTTNSYRKFLTDNNLALKNDEIKNGCAVDSE